MKSMHQYYSSFHGILRISKDKMQALYQLFINTIILFFVLTKPKASEKLPAEHSSHQEGMNQLSLLSLPFWGAYSIAKFGARKTCFSVLIMFLIAGGIFTPFVWAAPHAFKAGVWDHWEALCSHPYQWARQHIMNMNFSVLFYRYGQQGLLKYMQMGYCGVIFLLFIQGKYYTRLATTWMFIALTIFGFLQLNIIVWTYLFQPVLLIAVFAILSLGIYLPDMTEQH